MIGPATRCIRLSDLAVHNREEKQEAECAGRVFAVRRNVSRPSTADRSLVSIRPEVSGQLDRRLLVSRAACPPAGGLRAKPAL